MCYYQQMLAFHVVFKRFYFLLSLVGNICLSNGYVKFKLQVISRHCLSTILVDKYWSISIIILKDFPVLIRCCIGYEKVYQMVVLYRHVVSHLWYQILIAFYQYIWNILCVYWSLLRQILSGWLGRFFYLGKPVGSIVIIRDISNAWYFCIWSRVFIIKFETLGVQ
jgi:hypothetical protein